MKGELPPIRDREDKPRGYVAPGQRLRKRDVVTVVTIVGWVLAAYVALQLLTGN